MLENLGLIQENRRVHTDHLQLKRFIKNALVHLRCIEYGLHPILWTQSHPRSVSWANTRECQLLILLLYLREEVEVAKKFVGWYNPSVYCKLPPHTHTNIMWKATMSTRLTFLKEFWSFKNSELMQRHVCNRLVFLKHLRNYVFH